MAKGLSFSHAELRTYICSVSLSVQRPFLKSRCSGLPNLSAALHAAKQHALYVCAA